MKIKTPHINYITPRSAGFSLVELMVIIAIIAVLGAIAFPVFTKWLPNYRLKAAAQELYGTMQRGKLESIKSNSDFSMNFTPSATPCPSTGGGSYTITNDETAQVTSQLTYSKGICLSAGTNGGFNPRGLPNGPNLSVTLTHNQVNKTYVITQSTAGIIKLQ